MTSPGTARRAWRTPVAVLVGVVWVVGTWLVDGFAGTASTRLGWLWIGLVYAVGLLVAALVWGGRAALRSPLVLGCVLAGGLLVGLVDWQASPPTHERIAEVADDATMPESFGEVRVSEYGSTWCFKGCPVVSHSYTVDVPPAEVVEQAVAALEGTGWEHNGRTRTTADGSVHTRLGRGRWHVTVDTWVDSEGLTHLTLDHTG